MKKMILVLILCSFSCFAQQIDKVKLETMHANISAGRMFCSFQAQMGIGKAGGESPDFIKCRKDQIDKANARFFDARKQLENKPEALSALKKYYAAELAALEQIGTVDQRTEEQAELRVQELFNLFKLELL